VLHFNIPQTNHQSPDYSPEPLKRHFAPVPQRLGVENAKGPSHVDVFSLQESLRSRPTEGLLNSSYPVYRGYRPLHSLKLPACSPAWLGVPPYDDLLMKSRWIFELFLLSPQPRISLPLQELAVNPGSVWSRWSSSRSEEEAQKSQIVTQTLLGSFPFSPYGGKRPKAYNLLSDCLWEIVPSRKPHFKLCFAKCSFS